MGGIARGVNEMREAAAERELTGQRATTQHAADRTHAVQAALERALAAPGPGPEGSTESQGEPFIPGTTPLAPREEHRLVPVPAPHTTLTGRALR
jgi:hypothetical protein